MKTPLQEQQKRIVEKVKDPKSPGALLYWGLGSGKTIGAIAAAEAANAETKGTTDVVVPASLRENFKKELTKSTNRPSSFNVGSYEKFLKTPTNTPSKARTLILDEAHRIGQATSRRSTFFPQIAAKYDKRILLTGSPIRNYPHELAPLYNTIYGREILPMDPKKFDKVFIKHKKEFPGIVGLLKGVKPGTVDTINRKELLRKVVQPVTDYHDPTAATSPKESSHYPTVTTKTIEVPINKPQKELYNTILGKAPKAIQYKVKHNLHPAKSELHTLNAYLSGLRQVSNTTSGFLRNSNAETKSPKIDTAFRNLSSHLSKNPQHKAVVYSNYLSSGIEPVKARLENAHLPYHEFTGKLSDDKRKAAVDDYNKGKVRTLLISGAGSEGLDLKGTSLVQLLEPHWNDARLEQAIGRTVRYKSHDALPPALRKVEVQKYQSTIPKNWVQKVLGRKPQTSVDQYLDNLSKDKTKLNDQFLDVLKGK